MSEERGQSENVGHLIREVIDHKEILVNSAARRSGDEANFLIDLGNNLFTHKHDAEVQISVSSVAIPLAYYFIDIKRNNRFIYTENAVRYVITLDSGCYSNIQIGNMIAAKLNALGLAYTWSFVYTAETAKFAMNRVLTGVDVISQFIFNEPGDLLYCNELFGLAKSTYSYAVGVYSLTSDRVARTGVEEVLMMRIPEIANSYSLDSPTSYQKISGSVMLVPSYNNAFSAVVYIPQSESIYYTYKFQNRGVNPQYLNVSLVTKYGNPITLMSDWSFTMRIKIVSSESVS